MIAFELRHFRMEDLDALVKHASDPSVAANLTDSFPNPFTEEAARNFLDQAINTAPPLRRCIAIHGKAAGAIGLHAKQDVWRCNMELGYWIGKEFRGHGIMTEAIRRMVALGFVTFPEVTRIFATPFGSNIASQRSLEKAGFQLEAKLPATLIKNGMVEDELIYATRRP